MRFTNRRDSHRVRTRLLFGETEMGVASICGVCGLRFKHISQHVRQHPKCVTQLVVPPPRIDKEQLQELHYSLAPRLAADNLQSVTLWDLGGLRLERDFDAGDVKAVKEVAGRWQEASNELAAEQLRQAGLLRPGVDAAQVARVMRTDLFKGIRSDKCEKAARRAEQKQLQPRVTDLSGGDGRDANHIVVSISPLDMVEQRLQQCGTFRKAFLAESERLKSGESYRTPPPEMLRGYKDGVAARYHPHLMRPATPDEALDVRGALEFNADDVEVRCPCTVPAHTLLSCASVLHTDL